MWENADKTFNFNSYDLTFNLNESTTNDDTSNASIFSADDQINLTKNLSFMESFQTVFPNLDNNYVYNDDPLCFRKENSTQSFLVNDEFDLLGHPSKDNNLNRFNDFFNNGNTNNNNNISQNVPVKSSKRGRGRGSRGSYKPRGGNRSRLLNQSNPFPPSFNNPINNNLITYTSNNSNMNQPGASYMTHSSMSNPHQKVCINPEILRRLGYQQNNECTSSSVSNYQHQQALSQNYQFDDGNFVWNQTGNYLYQNNNQVFDSNFPNLVDSNQVGLYSNSVNSFPNENVVNYDCYKTNVEDVNYFAEFDSKCYLDISNPDHQMINLLPDLAKNRNSNDSNLDNFFDNISKKIKSTSDLINTDFTTDNSQLNFDSEKSPNNDEDNSLENENDSSETS